MEVKSLYQVLATETSFPEMADLAAYIAETPIAFISFRDSNYLWLKSQTGINNNKHRYLNFVEVILGSSEKNKTKLQKKEATLLIIPDTLADERIANHTLVVSEPKIRFYVGIPININGKQIGILSLMDYVSRSLTEKCQKLLKKLSLHISNQVELQRKVYSFSGKFIKLQEIVNAHPEEKTLLLLERAISASNNGIVITDNTHPHNPIIYCNPAFEKITGYSTQEILGKNCRFLQGADTDPVALSQIRQAIKSETNCLVVVKNYRKDGTPFWNELAISPVRDNNGRITNFIGIQTDITQTKQAEEALRDSEARYRLLTNHSTDLISRQTSEGIYLFASAACRHLLGYEPDELVGNCIYNLLHTADRKLYETNISEQQEGYTFTHRLRHKNSSYIWFETTCQKIQDPETGKVIELVAVSRDITERKRAEVALLERASLSTLEAEVGVALGSASSLNNILQHCTKAIVAELDVIGSGIWTINTQTSQLELQALSGNNLTLDIEHQHKLLTPKSILTSQFLNSEVNSDNEQQILTNDFTLLTSDSRVAGVMCIWSHNTLTESARDVLTWVASAIATAIDRVRTQEQLLSNREALLFRLASQIRDSLDIDKILGTAVTEIRNLLQIDQCFFIWCLSAQITSIAITHEASNPKISVQTPEYSSEQIKILSDKIRNREILQLDNTETVNQNQLKQMQQYLQDLGVKSTLLLPLQTRSGQMGGVVCNQYSTHRPWKESEVELLQAVVDQLAIAIDQAELYAQTRAAALAAQTQAHHLSEALKNLKQKEAQLIQQEKMSSLGQIVAGVAHEINNPVNFIHGNITYVKNYIRDILELLNLYQKYYPDPVAEIENKTEDIELDFLIEDLPKILSSMETGTERIRKIVISLRNFTRSDQAEKKIVDIHEGIDSTLLILDNRIRSKGKDSGIEIVKEYGSLPKVECYPGQLNQVFMNIIANSIDVLEGKPKPRIIKITTQLDSEEPEEEPLLKYATISVQDNGPGMKENLINRVFDPFFTTKPVGKGTGLGLSISYQIIVEKHSGILKCTSQLGKGTKFIIKIPIKAPKALK
ncbi:MAG: PAS domain S-box protein [Okeania sp. SIO2F4]|uniref:PAS domain S-box protein n=1 Tax=Okeania sp. SIO2F4 TaxID=2607790 RepID=UPI00142A30C5|nr:PAS domain S-box protein [Okeania sp. SIO2F4]NES04085.1 PAS domain S-box protein [Okeania sp. SIO2F4]